MAKSAAQKRRREAEAVQDQLESKQETQSEVPPSKKARTEESRSLFVRSLPPSATNETLTEFFSQYFPVKHATVVVDSKTKTSRGFGFVTFTDADDAMEAKSKLDGQLMDGRRLQLDLAEPRHRAGMKDGSNVTISRVAEEKKKRQDATQDAMKPAKLIVRNLPWSVKTSANLTTLFQMYGKIKFADLPTSKAGRLSGFGFVTFRGRKNAEKAMEEVNGKVVDGRTLAVDWAVDKETWNKAQENDVRDGAPNGTVTETRAEGDIGTTEDQDDKLDEDMTEEDRDMQNFMKNRMEHLEDEEGEDEFEEAESLREGEGVDGETAALDVPKRAKSDSSDNSTTIFIRNLPYTATDDDVKEHFAQFGAVRYARVVMDRATSRPAGTGFVCFFNVEDTKSCLKGAPRRKQTPALGKHSILQDETLDQDGLYTMDGRVLKVAQAVSREEAAELASDNPVARGGVEKDKRRLFLLAEGTISRNSPLYSKLAPGEVQLREASAKQRKKMVDTNPGLHLSLTRLALRNIPQNMDSKALKALAREAVVGFAKDVKDGRRQPLSKEEKERGGQQDKDAERRRKQKGKGIVTQAKIVFENKEGSKVSESTAGKSRGYGFIEYSSHRSALMGLRWLNGHALKNEAGKMLRLIVEFAVENVNVVSRRRANEEKSRTFGPPKPKNRVTTTGDAEARKAPGGRIDKQSKKGSKANSKKLGKTTQEEEKDEEAESKKAKATEKLAMRQRIIGRKRMMRKKKALVRKGK